MYQYRATVNRIVDGDTIDVSLHLGLDASKYLAKRLKGLSTLIIKTELEGSVGKYGRVLGWLYTDEYAVASINSDMVDEGYAWMYDGGSKDGKDLEKLINIRKAKGTY